MRRMTPVIIISILIFLIIVFFLYQYFINIYEINVTVEPETLYADNNSQVLISVLPLNAFGWKAPFRSSPAEFEIIEGESLVEIKLLNKEKGKLILKSKYETGMVTVKIISDHSLFPVIVEIQVNQNLSVNY